MKLYIIRHGETAWNVEGRLQGQSDCVNFYKEVK